MSAEEKIKPKYKLNLLSKIALGALVVIGGGLGIYKTTQPRIFNSSGEVTIIEPILSRGHWGYSAYENGGEYFSRMHDKYGAAFEDKNGDGVFEEIAIMCNYYRGEFGAFYVWLDPNDFEHEQWSEKGWEEIAKKRNKYQKHIPFSKILEKIKDK